MQFHILQSIGGTLIHDAAKKGDLKLLKVIIAAKGVEALTIQREGKLNNLFPQLGLASTVLGRESAATKIERSKGDLQIY